jgi:hypothetical protein
LGKCLHIYSPVFSAQSYRKISIDATNSEKIRERAGPIAEQLQVDCHDTHPWLISFSLDLCAVAKPVQNNRGRRIQRMLLIDEAKDRTGGLLTGS